MLRCKPGPSWRASRRAVGTGDVVAHLGYLVFGAEVQTWAKLARVAAGIGRGQQCSSARATRVLCQGANLGQASARRGGQRAAGRRVQERAQRRQDAARVVAGPIRRRPRRHAVRGRHRAHVPQRCGAPANPGRHTSCLRSCTPVKEIYVQKRYGRLGDTGPRAPSCHGAQCIRGCTTHSNARHWRKDTAAGRRCRH